MAISGREFTSSGYLNYLYLARVSRVVLLLLALCNSPLLLAAEVAAMPTRSLRVATGIIAPFVLKEGDKLTGFSVELWNEVARRMRVEFA